MSLTGRSRSFAASVVACSLAALFSGCASGSNQLFVDAKAKTIEKRIYDGSLQGDAEILGGKSLYNELLMQAVVDIQSHASKTQKLYYKFTWYDSDGFQQADTPWQFLALNAQEHKQVTGTAPSPRAERVEFFLRRKSEEDHEN